MGDQIKARPIAEGRAGSTGLQSNPARQLACVPAQPMIALVGLLFTVMEERVLNVPMRPRLSRRCLILPLLAWLFTLAPIATSHDVYAQSPAQTVRLVIDYGDGFFKVFDGLSWAKGNTVLDTLNAAKASAHPITFSYTGQGTSAFLTEIDGVVNQGGGSSAKNWQFWVNSTYADRSFAIFGVQALDLSLIHI